MADIVYTVTQDSPETITGFEQYSEQDKALINSFQINSVFDPAKHYSELHILSLADDLLESSYTYSSYKLLGNAQSAGQAGASVLTVDPIQDSKAYGYENGGIKLLYHFLNDLYTEDNSTVEFYIQDISPDRTEISLSTLNLSPEVITSTTSLIKNTLENQSYFTGFRLDFKNNDLFIATNIDTLDVGSEKVVVVKLYEPLPTTYGIKSTLNIVDIVSDSVSYEVDSEIVIPPSIAPTLRSPNFNIEVMDESVIPTQYYSYDDLFSYPVTNANSQIFSTVNEKGIDISVDYTSFTDFVHFSSAQERLLNFKYKLDLIFNYSGSIASGSTATTGLQGISGSKTYYEGLITGIVNNFDHYERFLYYESGSSSWPKSNTTKPYTNKISSDSEAITWYTDQITNAIEYDLTNYNSLVYSIPTYLRDDSNNENYLTFVYMVGQHFDNLWLYSKAVTDKYDADNRIDHGISKDLVAEALKNFGVKLYTSNKSTEDLFTTFIGQAYQSGSEVINNYITGSIPGIPITSGIPTSSVVIGNQIWATQNLDVSTYSDGTLIPQVTDSTEWTNATSGAWCYYGNNSSSGSVYGKLYNWYAVAGIHDLASLTDVGQRKQLAPTGYRIPSNTDWNTLITTLGGSGVAGGAIRETGTAHWLSTNSTATNSSGFTGLGGSDRGQTGVFDTIKLRGYWWSSTLESETAATAFYTQYTDSGIYNDGAGFRYGFSVRCLEDGVPMTPDTPIQPTSYDIYQKEVQKRIYHNLPLLLKSKGTERGLRALINCYGIPGDILDIKLSGGRNTNELPFFGDYRTYTGSIDKVRLDNTGSIVTGSTLSSFTSIVKRDQKYTDDLHLIEVGFSPTDNVDQYIISQSAPTFNIDQYLGDPNNLTSGSYSGLQTVAEGILGSLEQYNLQDYVRLIKFFDNTIFKTIKDFIPAKTTADTGVIIKPNLLNRSKAKSVTVTATQPEYTGSIDTAFITGSDGGAFTTSTGHSDPSWIEVLQTPQGLANSYTNQGTDQPLFTGELGGTEILVADGELNEANPHKVDIYDETPRNVILIQDFPPDICAIESSYPSVNITTPQNVDIRSGFNIPGDNYVTYYSGSTNITTTASAFPMTTNYTTFAITASKTGIAGCTGSKVYTTSFCSISLTVSGSTTLVQQNTPYDLTTWFTSPYNTNLSYTLYTNSGTISSSISNSGSYIFTVDTGSYVYVEVSDPITIASCTQKTGDILVQPQVTLTMDTSASNYLYNGLSLGPNTSTLTNRFYPDTPGARTYYYYGTPFTGSTYTTQSNQPTASGNYEVYVRVPADIFYPEITSSRLPFTINKNLLTIKANDRLIPTEGTGSGFVTGSTNNTYTVLNLQNNELSGSVISGTVTYTSNYTTATPSGTTGIYLRPIVTGLSAINYTFTGSDGIVTIGGTTYNPSDYSADDYITGSI